MSIYFRDYPDFDTYWENLKQPLVSSHSVTDPSVLVAMDQMAAFGYNHAKDSASSDPSSVLAAVKSANGVTGSGSDQALIDSYEATYNSFGSNPNVPPPPPPF
jgi:hypothetical protein